MHKLFRSIYLIISNNYPTSLTILKSLGGLKGVKNIVNDIYHVVALVHIRIESGVGSIGNVVDESVVTNIFFWNVSLTVDIPTYISISTLIIFLSHKIKWTYFVEYLEIYLYGKLSILINVVTADNIQPFKHVFKHILPCNALAVTAAIYLPL